MVKAGVYLLIRLAPALAGTMTGNMVAFIGGFTFIAASMMAIAQNDGKKVLAFSTISNLGLIVALRRHRRRGDDLGGPCCS